MDVHINSEYRVDESFLDHDKLIANARRAIRDNIKQICNGHKVYFGPGNNLFITLFDVYEGGVIYDIVCPIDAAANKYNTATSALLIVRNDGTVKLILDGVDRRVNPEAPETTTFWAQINDEIIDKELSLLGPKLKESAQSQMKGPFKKKRREFAEKKNEIIMKMKSILVKQSTDKLAAAILDDREQKEAQR